MLKKLLTAFGWTALAFWMLSVFYILFMMHHRPSWEMTLSEFLKYNTNFVPFKTIFGYFDLLGKNAINTDIFVNNLLGNFALFIPMGFLLPVLTDKLRSSGKLTLTAFVVNFALESAQVLFKLGRFDIDDIILRTIGTLAGFAVWYVISKIIRVSPKTVEAAAK